MENKIFLIHWNAAEAQAYAGQLERFGWQVDSEAEDGARAARTIRATKPDLVVIYLSRLPSHGRETADYLRSLKSTRDIPVIFVGGEGEALEKIKAKLPLATYTTAEELESTLKTYSK
ncbi:MAG TPA: response regulator [Anaerolineales bacterium]